MKPTVQVHFRINAKDKRHTTWNQLKYYKTFIRTMVRDWEYEQFLDLVESQEPIQVNETDWIVQEVSYFENLAGPIIRIKLKLNKVS